MRIYVTPRMIDIFPFWKLHSFKPDRDLGHFIFTVDYINWYTHDYVKNQWIKIYNGRLDQIEHTEDLQNYIVEKGISASDLSKMDWNHWKDLWAKASDQYETTYQLGMAYAHETNIDFEFLNTFYINADWKNGWFIPLNTDLVLEIPTDDYRFNYYWRNYLVTDGNKDTGVQNGTDSENPASVLLEISDCTQYEINDTFVCTDQFYILDPDMVLHGADQRITWKQLCDKDPLTGEITIPGIVKGMFLCTSYIGDLTIPSQDSDKTLIWLWNSINNTYGFDTEVSKYFLETTEETSYLNTWIKTQDSDWTFVINDIYTGLMGAALRYTNMLKEVNYLNDSGINYGVDDYNVTFNFFDYNMQDNQFFWLKDYKVNSIYMPPYNSLFDNYNSNDSGWLINFYELSNLYNCNNLIKTNSPKTYLNDSIVSHKDDSNLIINALKNSSEYVYSITKEDDIDPLLLNKNYLNPSSYQNNINSDDKVLIYNNLTGPELYYENAFIEKINYLINNKFVNSNDRLLTFNNLGINSNLTTDTFDFIRTYISENNYYIIKDDYSWTINTLSNNDLINYSMNINNFIKTEYLNDIIIGDSNDYMLRTAMYSTPNFTQNLFKAMSNFNITDALNKTIVTNDIYNEANFDNLYGFNSTPYNYLNKNIPNNSKSTRYELIINPYSDDYLGNTDLEKDLNFISEFEVKTSKDSNTLVLIDLDGDFIQTEFYYYSKTDIKSEIDKENNSELLTYDINNDALEVGEYYSIKDIKKLIYIESHYLGYDFYHYTFRNVIDKKTQDIYFYNGLSYIGQSTQITDIILESIFDDYLNLNTKYKVNNWKYINLVTKHPYYNASASDLIKRFYPYQYIVDQKYNNYFSKSNEDLLLNIDPTKTNNSNFNSSLDTKFLSDNFIKYSFKDKSWIYDAREVPAFGFKIDKFIINDSKVINSDDFNFITNELDMEGLENNNYLTNANFLNSDKIKDPKDFNKIFNVLDTEGLDISTFKLFDLTNSSINDSIMNTKNDSNLLFNLYYYQRNDLELNTTYLNNNLLIDINSKSININLMNAETVKNNLVVFKDSKNNYLPDQDLPKMIDDKFLVFNNLSRYENNFSIYNFKEFVGNDKYLTPGIQNLKDTKNNDYVLVFSNIENDYLIPENCFKFIRNINYQVDTRVLIGQNLTYNSTSHDYYNITNKQFLDYDIHYTTWPMGEFGINYLVQEIGKPADDYTIINSIPKFDEDCKIPSYYNNKYYDNFNSICITPNQNIINEDDYTMIYNIFDQNYIGNQEEDNKLYIENKYGTAYVLNYTNLQNNYFITEENYSLIYNIFDGFDNELIIGGFRSFGGQFQNQNAYLEPLKPIIITSNDFDLIYNALGLEAEKINTFEENNISINYLNPAHQLTYNSDDFTITSNYLKLLDVVKDSTIENVDFIDNEFIETKDDTSIILNNALDVVKTYDNIIFNKDYINNEFINLPDDYQLLLDNSELSVKDNSFISNNYLSA